MAEKQAIYYELLVLRCQQGRRAALEELIHTWEKRLFYYIRRLIDDEAQAWSILQETWLKVLKDIKKLREPRKLPSWLYSIARNTVIDHLRNKYSRQAMFGNNENIADVETSDFSFNFDNAEAVHYGLGRLSLHHREVLTLLFLQDLSIDEIARVLQIPVGTVKSRLYHAKRALKAVLEKEAGNYE